MCILRISFEYQGVPNNEFFQRRFLLSKESKHLKYFTGIVLAEPVPAAQPNPPEVVGDNNSDPLGVNANNPHIQTERNITSTRSSATNGVAVNLHSEPGSLGDGAGRSGQPGAAERPPPYEARQDS